MRSERDGTVPRQNIAVNLPPGKGLYFEPGTSIDHSLSVYDSEGQVTNYIRNLSPDGQTFNFMNVDPALPSRGSVSTMWVAITATSTAPTGGTNLPFTIGDRTSNSSQIDVA